MVMKNGKERLLTVAERTQRQEDAEYHNEIAKVRPNRALRRKDSLGRKRFVRRTLRAMAKRGEIPING